MTHATEIPRSGPRPRRRWFRYSLTTLLGLVTVLCLVLGLWVQRAERQRRAVAAVQSLGGVVHYGDESGDDSVHVPKWLLTLLGDDYFRSVTRLRLANPQVGDHELEQLKDLTALQVLRLEFTRVSDVGLAHLQGLTELRGLNLDHTQVSGPVLHHLKGMTKLQGLYIESTPLGDTALGHLNGLTALEELGLEDTQVTDAGLIHLKTLTNLRMLHLYNTQVSDAGCERLQIVLPNCRIIR
jgi:Leucine-rich repeat (LRR) protein